MVNPSYDNRECFVFPPAPPPNDPPDGGDYGGGGGGNGDGGDGSTTTTTTTISTTTTTTTTTITTYTTSQTTSQTTEDPTTSTTTTDETETTTSEEDCDDYCFKCIYVGSSDGSCTCDGTECGGDEGLDTDEDCFCSCSWETYECRQHSPGPDVCKCEDAGMFSTPEECDNNTDCPYTERTDGPNDCGTITCYECGETSEEVCKCNADGTAPGTSCEPCEEGGSSGGSSSSDGDCCCTYVRTEDCPGTSYDKCEQSDCGEGAESEAECLEECPNSVTIDCPDKDCYKCEEEEVQFCCDESGGECEDCEATGCECTCTQTQKECVEDGTVAYDEECDESEDSDCGSECTNGDVEIDCPLSTWNCEDWIGTASCDQDGTPSPECTTCLCSCIYDLKKCVPVQDSTGDFASKEVCEASEDCYNCRAPAAECLSPPPMCPEEPDYTGSRRPDIEIIGDPPLDVPKWACVGTTTTGKCTGDGEPSVAGNCDCVWNTNECQQDDNGPYNGKNACLNDSACECQTPDFSCINTKDCPTPGGNNEGTEAEETGEEEPGWVCLEPSPEGQCTYFGNVEAGATYYDTALECRWACTDAGSICGDGTPGHADCADQLGWTCLDPSENLCIFGSLTDGGVYWNSEAECQADCVPPPELGGYVISDCTTFAGGSQAACAYDDWAVPESDGVFGSSEECECENSRIYCGNSKSWWVDGRCCENAQCMGVADRRGPLLDDKPLEIAGGYGFSSSKWIPGFSTRPSRRPSNVYVTPKNPNAPKLKWANGTVSVWRSNLESFLSKKGPGNKGNHGHMDFNVRDHNADQETYDMVSNPYAWIKDEFLDIAGWSKYFDTTDKTIRRSPIGARSFFYIWRSLQGPLIAKVQTRKKISLIAMDAPNKGGSVFVREPTEDGEGYNAYVVTGRNHAIELPPEDSFDPLGGEGTIIYGKGKIYYNGGTSFNFSQFVGAVRTKNGVYIISESKPLMMPKTTALLKVRNQQHLNTLRKYDPPFLIPAFNSKINIGSPRREWQEVNQDGITKFSSHADPGFYYVASFKSPMLHTNGAIADKRYGFNLPTFEEAAEVGRDFIPYINEAKTGNNIFKKISHRGVAAVLKIMEDNRADYDPHYLFDITNRHIYQSLKEEVSKILDGMQDISGDKLARGFFLDTFHKMILNNTIDDFDFNYIKNYYTTKIGNLHYGRPYDDVRTLEPLSVGVDSRFGFTAQMLREQRTKKIGSKVKARRIPSLVKNSEDVVSTAIKNLKSIDFRQYPDPDTREKLKRWHVIPSDIRLNLNLSLADGTNIHAMVDNDETIKFTVGATSYSLSCNEKYQIPITRGGATSYLPLDYDNLKYAYVLPNATKQKIFNSLNSEEGPTMQVRTDDTKTMLTSEVTSTLPNSYVLVLDSTTIQELPKKHEFVRTTETLYKVSTEVKAATVVNGSPFPYRTFYVDYNDPILTMLESEQEAYFYFNSISFDGFGPNLTVNLVREIPKYIRIIPTNKTKNSPFHGLSRLLTLSNAKDESVRRLVFIRGIDKERYKTKLDDPPGYSLNYPWPNKDVAGDSSTRDTIEYLTKETEPVFSNEANYITGSQPARTVPSIDILYDVVTKLLERFILADGLTIYDVLARLGAKNYYNLFNGETAPEVIEQIKTGNTFNMGTAATNVPWYKNTIYNNITGGGANQYMARSRLVKTRTGSTPTDYDLEIYDNYSDRSYIGETFEQREAKRIQEMDAIPISDRVPRTGV